MAALQNIFERINDLEATIYQIENSRDNELTFADEMALGSLQSQREDLLANLNSLTEKQKVDICDFRLIPDSNADYPIKSVGGILSSFQETFTALFASIRDRKPRSKAKYSTEIHQASELSIGYAYSGSLGLVMYSRSDSFLDEDSDHDLAFSSLLDLTALSSPTEVREASSVYGKAALSAFYRWSRSHYDWNMSVDVKWRRGDRQKYQKLIQPAQFRSVIDIMEHTPDTSEDTEVVNGILVALDVRSHSFKLSTSDGNDIRGTFDDDFDWKMPHEIPGRYKATVKKTIVRTVWSEDEDVTWSLIDLVEMK